jgi:hypothetical protein
MHVIARKVDTCKPTKPRIRPISSKTALRMVLMCASRELLSRPTMSLELGTEEVDHL